MFLKKQLNILILIYKRIRVNSFVKVFLSFFSLIYLSIVLIRKLLYKLTILRVHKVNAYVISIGNITLGGSGKTPLTIELTNHFIAQGFKVAIISRGYNRTITDKSQINNLLVSDGEDIIVSFDLSGDEPYLIAKKSPKAIVISSRNRVLAANSAIKLGAQIIILDDGFQHLKLHRDKNIVLIDGSNNIFTQNIFPAGDLREPISSLKRADLIVISNYTENNYSNKAIKSIAQIAPNSQVLKMHYEISHLKGINIIKKTEKKNIRGMKALIFSGLGNPDSFINSLNDSGVSIIKHIDFSDHYKYEYNDIKNLSNIATELKITDVITTEKDAVKIEELCQAEPVTFWNTEINIIWDDINPYNQIIPIIPKR